MNEINLERVKQTQYDISSKAISLTDLKNLLEKDYIGEEAKKQINKQFWELVDKLTNDKELETWRDKAHKLAVKYKACLTCFEKGDNWNYGPETFKCKKCGEVDMKKA